MDFKCVSVGSSTGRVMEKIASNEQFRNMKKQLLWGRREERKAFTKKKEKRKCQIISTLTCFSGIKKKIKF